MSAFTLSRRAQAQLAEILRYSVRRWGPAQADAYRAALRACFEAMAEGTAHVIRFEAPGGPYWRHRCRHHLIFAIEVGGSLRIIAVLHERTDVQAWLAEAR